MIRLAFMCDKARVIGATTPEGNAKRFEVLPPALHGVMGGLYQTQIAVIAGSRSLFGLTLPQFATARRLCLSRSTQPEIPEGLENLEITSNVRDLAREYSGSEELLVIGGKAVFELFLPFAQQIDIAETKKLVPGDVIFDAWESAPFVQSGSADWEGGRTLTLKRQK